MLHWTAVADQQPSWVILCREGERADADSYHDLMRSRFGKWGGRAVALAQVSGLCTVERWKLCHGMAAWRVMPRQALLHHAMPCHAMALGVRACSGIMACMLWMSAVCHAP